MINSERAYRHPESQYAELMKKAFMYGFERSDRTGVGTRGVFGATMSFDLSDGFPLFGGRYISFDTVKKELLWFISGSTNVNDLGTRIWDPWAHDNGDLGPVYGAQWRNWGGCIDQLQDLEINLFTNPDSRRHIVTAWDPAALPQMALPPCHLLFQCNSRPLRLDELRDRSMVRFTQNKELRALDMQVYQRSADLFIGVPHNIASYALLLHMLAHTTLHMVGTLHWVGGDCHVYCNHEDAVLTYYARAPELPPFPLLEIGEQRTSIDEFRASDFHVHGYDPHPKIEAPVAV